MRKLRNKFGRPRMIWNTALIAEDKHLFEEYGLRRKKEIWSVRSLVSNFRRRARELNAEKNTEKEKLLLDKINKLGFLKAASLDDILSLSIKNVLDRRLQTILYKKGLAKTPVQARQFIVHGHVRVGGKKANVPSYIVDVNEEAEISINIDVKAANPTEPPKAAASKPQEGVQEENPPTKAEAKP